MLSSVAWRFYFSFFLWAPVWGQLATSPSPKFRIDLQNTGRSAYGATPPQSTISVVITNWAVHNGGWYQSSTPAIGFDGKLYAPSYHNGGNSYFTCYNPDGTTQWTTWIGMGCQSSPAIGSDGKIYFGSLDQYFYSFYNDGTLRWKRFVEAQVISSPTIGNDGKIYVGGFYFYCFNPDGTTNWKVLTGGVQSCPAIGPDFKIYTGSLWSNIYCFAPDGKTNWVGSTSGAKVKSSPALGSDGKVYVGAEDGYFYSYLPGGTINWRASTDGSILSSPAVSIDGKIYVGSSDGYFYCFRADGTTNWRSGYLSMVNSSPCIGSDGKIYVACSDGYLYCFNEDGSTNWRAGVKGTQCSGSPAIDSGGKIYQGDNAGYLNCFSIQGYLPTGSTTSGPSTNTVFGTRPDVNRESDSPGKIEFQIYPNPFSSRKANEPAIFFRLNQKPKDLGIFTLDGGLVCRIDGNLSSVRGGGWDLKWDLKTRGGRLSPGVYLVVARSISGSTSEVKKLVVEE